MSQGNEERRYWEVSELRSVARLRGTARVNQGCDRHAESFGYGSPTLTFCVEPHRLVSSEGSFGRPTASRGLSPPVLLR